MDAFQRSVLLFVMFIDHFAVGIIVPHVVEIALTSGADWKMIGQIEATYATLQLVGAVFIGMLSDMYGRRTTLLSVLILTAMSYFLLFNTASLVTIFWSRALTGLAKHGSPVILASVTDGVSKSSALEPLSKLSNAKALGMMLGSAVGGYISPQHAGGVVAALFGLNLFVVYTWFEEPTKLTPMGKKISNTDVLGRRVFPIKESSLQHLLSSKVAHLLLIWTVMALALSVFRGSLQIIVKTHTAINAIEFGWLKSLLSLVEILSGWWVQRNAAMITSANEELVLVAVLVVAACSVLTMIVCTGLWSLASAIIPFYIALSLGRVCFKTLLISKSDGQSKGTLLAMMEMAMSSSRLLGPLAAGYLVQTISTSAPQLVGASLWLTAAAMVVASSSSSSSSSASSPPSSSSSSSSSSSLLLLSSSSPPPSKSKST